MQGSELRRILVSRASRPRVTFIGPGIHGTGSARKLTVVSKAHALELGPGRLYKRPDWDASCSTRNNFHRAVLRRNEVFVLIYFEDMKKRSICVDIF